jgi:hypothetical protein
MTKANPDLGSLAEKFIEQGLWDADLVEQLDDAAIDELFEHLVAHSAVETAAATADVEPVVLNDEQQTAVVNLQSYYLGEVARRPEPASAEQQLARPSTWLAIEPAVRDRDFLIRLQQRRLRGLGQRCLRDLADLLGQSRAAVRDFLAGPPDYGLATAENRNRGKPQDDGAEEFAAALARSQIPDVFKRRWLEDEL